jgi:uncharacterized protein with HEPN domain
MNAPRVPDYLGHMLAAAQEARDFIAEQSREAFLADRRSQQAVVMSLLIIGEAAAKIMHDDLSFVRSHPEIPWSSMRGMRNRMAHGYFETNYELVWETVEIEIPRLIVELTALVGPPRPSERGEAGT